MSANHGKRGSSEPSPQTRDVDKWSLSLSPHRLNHVATPERPSGEGTDVFSNTQMVGDKLKDLCNAGQ